MGEKSGGEQAQKAYFHQKNILAASGSAQLLPKRERAKSGNQGDKRHRYYALEDDYLVERGGRRSQKIGKAKRAKIHTQAKRPKNKEEERTG